MIKGFLNKYFYSFISVKYSRGYGENPAECDICGCRVGWQDYFYMCRNHGDIYYKTWRRFLPKFIWRWCPDVL